MPTPQRILVLLVVACFSVGFHPAHANYGEKIEFVSGSKQEKVLGYLSLPANTDATAKARSLQDIHEFLKKEFTQRVRPAIAAR